jgi:hypothetical protein
VKCGRRRGVKKKCDREGFVGGFPIGDCLFNAVLENAEVFTVQVRDETALAIQDTDRNCDQTSVDADYIAFSYLFRTRINRRGRGRR